MRKMKRKGILSNSLRSIVVSIAIFGVLSVSTFGNVIQSTPFDETTINADLNSTIKPDHVTLTWSADPMTTQTITWRTNKTVVKGEVKFKKASDSKYITSEIVNCILS